MLMMMILKLVLTINNTNMIHYNENNTHNKRSDMKGQDIRLRNNNYYC